MILHFLKVRAVKSSSGSRDLGLNGVFRLFAPQGLFGYDFRSPSLAGSCSENGLYHTPVPGAPV
jgi:hypothetical protein